MKTSKAFWAFLGVMELVVISLVFLVTRQYYIEQQPSALPPGALPAQLSSGANGFTAPQLAPAIDFSQPRTPEQLAALADEHFGNRQYEAAATIYEQLLQLDAGNADLINNLALTLHYIGRSNEALTRLNEGLVIDPAHQRMWLTRGFIFGQLGNTNEASDALNRVIELDANSPLANSAREMLDNLN